jgi:Transglycosylase SLT domain
MGRSDREADGSPASAKRWRNVSLPVGTPPVRRLAAVGAVAVLGLAVQDGTPALAAGIASPAGMRHRATDPLSPTEPSSVAHLQASGWAVAPEMTSLATMEKSSEVVAEAEKAGPFRQIILPDLLVVAPKGLTASQVTKLREIAGVRNMITFDGAEITAGGRPVSVIGVDPSTFRSWVPLAAASDQAIWSALSRGEFVASLPWSQRLGLKAGKGYTLNGATSQVVPYAMSASLGLSGVDLLVNEAVSHKLGLVRQVAGLISAPGVSLATLDQKVSKILGPGGRIEVLRSQKLPVASVSPGTRPTTYLELFKASAADYCPGLSWTVLAAIGQIESADGENMGPSTAGALGPMQFLPSTWAIWGIDGFGETGTPDILNPYDAVPSAARLLCADGATAGGSSLRQAIFDYNHATWYVNEVLALAAEYAADYD